MKTKLEESKTCCCVDVGAVIDGEECNTAVSEVWAEQAQAQARLDKLTDKAEAAANDPCQISSDIAQVEQGYQLDFNVNFSCQAENLIFQMSMNR